MASRNQRSPDGGPDLTSAGSMSGQVSYAPTIQTTVVTTTTTTTTSFPPFVMTAPRNLLHRDPELYPLASKPTPAPFKKLHFDINGQKAVFEESEDPEESLQNFQHKQASLRAHNGTIQTVSSSPNHANRRSSTSDQDSSSRSSFISPNYSRKLSLATSYAPPSSENIPFQRPNKRIRTIPSRLQIPEATDHADSVHEDKVRSQRTAFLLPLSSRARNAKEASENARPIAGSATPPAAETDFNPFDATMPQVEGPLRPSLPTLRDTSPFQDASLPSPSLSPITAAAQLSRASTASRLRDREDPESRLLPPSPLPIDDDCVGNSNMVVVMDDTGKVSNPERTHSGSKQPSFTDIPGMLDSFDSMPDNLKSYVMYQLLRRCSKPTLHFVADIIEPALKCDFLARLPLELGLNILHYLDAKSLCRAAQVSKRWRGTINADEPAWKNLLDEDGFIVTETEIQRAIEEGWGWQSPHGPEGGELNLSARQSFIENASSPSGASDAIDDAMLIHPGGRRKRKATGRLSGQKRQKRKSSSAVSTTSLAHIAGLETSQGPYAYAQAAMQAVPDPKIGLATLSGLHLFKTIYQRHYMMRQAWMSPETKPKHLAFRAHQRHVVTCLQFDSEKIITGSDDSNIDIYDTQTGASIRSLRGHEGGVWALEDQDNMLVSGSTDRSVRIWNIDNGECLHVFQGHTSTVRCLQIVRPVKIGETLDGKPIIMPKHPLIITGSRDSTCRVWLLPKPNDPSIFQAAPAANDFDNPYFQRALAGHTHSVRAIAAYGDTLVSGSYDASVRVWKISTGELIHRLLGHTSKVYSVVLDHDRGRCISGSMDNLVKVWSLETGNLLFNLEGHTSLVGLLDLRENTLVSAAADSTLRVWDPENGRCQHVLSAHTGAITCFSHDGQKVISGSDRTLKMWNTKTGECVRDMLTDLSGVWQIRFDERRCIAAVQRNDWTYIEVLDFGASRDGVPECDRGRRIVVNGEGLEVDDDDWQIPQAGPDAIQP